MGAFFLADVLEKVRIDPYNFRITRLSARKSTDETFLGDKNMPISTFYMQKIHSTMPCLSGFELYSRWVPLTEKGTSKTAFLF